MTRLQQPSREMIETQIATLMKRAWLEQEPTSDCFDYDDDRAADLLAILERIGPTTERARQHLLDCTRCCYLYAITREARLATGGAREVVTLTHRADDIYQLSYRDRYGFGPTIAAAVANLTERLGGEPLPTSHAPPRMATDTSCGLVCVECQPWYVWRSTVADAVADLKTLLTIVGVKLPDNAYDVAKTITAWMN